MKRRWVVLASVTVAGVAIGVGLLRPGSREDSLVRAAGSVHSVTFDSLGSGGRIELVAFRGRPVIVNYFATWCPFCIAEMPAFERVHASLGDRVAFVGVALADDPVGAQSLVSKTGVTYTVAQDPEGRSFDRLGGRGMPTTVFVDARGRILELFSGPLSEDALRARISKHFDV